MILERFDRDNFLRHYWQRKPLLIRHTGSGFVDPIEADELAGFACEDDMESRLVEGADDKGWRVRHGPLAPAIFDSLGEREWTVLVQALDQVLPGVADLKSHFNFLPGWRLDDVMVSFAADGGGVGPHFDRYDVFLIQGQGSRLWRLGGACDARVPVRTENGLHLLETFEPEVEHRLQPGDILYLPPGIAHQGISVGASLCYSIGFRAPSAAEAVLAYAESTAQADWGDLRYRDSAAPQFAPSGALDDESIFSFLEKIKTISYNKSNFMQIFGTLVTEPRYPERIQPADPEFGENLFIKNINKASQEIVIKVNPSSRFAWHAEQDSLTLFVDGESIACPTQQRIALEHLCNTPWTQPLDIERLRQIPGVQALLIELLNRGSLVLEP